MTSWEIRNKLLLCLTPVHVGEGGMQIGPVDNVVIRGVSDREPYFPGTTILGNYSQFAYLWAQCHCRELVERKAENVIDYGTEKDKREMTRYQLLFGLDRGQENTPEEQIHEKSIRLDSAKILWIPCMTLNGPKLVTSRERFTRVLDIEIPDFAEDEILTSNSNLFNDKELKQQEEDLYWLNLKNLKVTAVYGKWPDDFPDRIKQKLPAFLKEKKLGENLVFVKESLFPYIIAKSIEIRTSVSIDRVTHAGKDGALFTYELIPRGTVLYFSITVVPNVAEKYGKPADSCLEKDKSAGVWEILDKVKPYFEMVGIGGMTSRGFGKCKILDLDQGA